MLVGFHSLDMLAGWNWETQGHHLSFAGWFALETKQRPIWQAPALCPLPPPSWGRCCSAAEFTKREVCDRAVCRPPCRCGLLRAGARQTRASLSNFRLNRSVTPPLWVSPEIISSLRELSNFEVLLNFEERGRKANPTHLTILLGAHRFEGRFLQAGFLSADMAGRHECKKVK